MIAAPVVGQIMTDGPAHWAAKLPFYYGWLVLAASAVCEMSAMGATSYSAGLFVLPLQSEFHLSRAAANLAVPLLFLGAMVFMPFVGRILDTSPIRRVTVFGIVLLCLALVLIATTPSVGLMIFALMVPAALGFVILSSLTTSTLASRWFCRRRGFALGVAAVATSGGGLTVAPLMSLAISHYGWRSALIIEAAVFFGLLTALALLVLRDSPASLGLENDPEIRHRQEAAAAVGPGDGFARTLRNWKETLGRRGFWAPALMVAAISGLCQGLVVSIVPYGVQLGAPATKAALLISAFSLVAALTKIVAGLLLDRIEMQVLLFFAGACMVAAWGVLCSLASLPALFAATCLSAMALGAALPTSAALIAARFGAARFGTTMAWAYVLIAGLTIAASVVAGAVFDRTHGYHLAFVIFLVFSAAVSLAAAFAERAPRSTRSALT